MQNFSLISRFWQTRSLGDGCESSQYLAWGKADPTVCMSGPSNEWPIAVKYGADDITLTGSTTFLDDQLLAKKKCILYSSWTA